MPHPLCFEEPMMTHTSLTLESMSYQELARDGQAGHRAHINVPASNVDAQTHARTIHATLEDVMARSYWETEQNMDRWTRNLNSTSNRNGDWVAAGASLQGSLQRPPQSITKSHFDTSGWARSVERRSTPLWKSSSRARNVRSGPSDYGEKPGPAVDAVFGNSAMHSASESKPWLYFARRLWSFARASLTAAIVSSR
jgi:hypothetical protein